VEKTGNTDISLSNSPKGPFKNAQGVYLTRQLFVELSDSERNWCLYSLRPDDYTIDGKVYPSLRRLYVELGDESEYEFAKRYFDGWTHWQRLVNSPWFMEYLKPIRSELQAKLMSDALKHIRKKAASGDYHANKYLYERGLVSTNPVGRPSKAKIQQEAEKLVQDKSYFDEDIKRLQEFL
jgi:hypothetical protein